MEEPKTKRCGECGEALRPIRLIDRDGGSHFDVEYAAIDAVRSSWLGQYPTEGHVVAYLCEGCGRVVLFAEPLPGRQ